MLSDALRGVQAQTVAPAEVIVIDDCSEEPLELTTDVPPELPVRFVRHPRNLGPAASVLHGIREARCELISTLNHDDVWEPRFLERLGEALELHPEACFAFCDHGIMLADGEHDERRSLEHSAQFGRAGLQTGLFIGAQLYKTAVLDKGAAASSFMLVRRAALDLTLIAAGSDMWDYFLAVGACRAGDAAAFVGERLGWYRLSPTMLSATWVDPRKQVAMARVQIEILIVILRTPQFAPIHAAVRRRLAYAIRRALAAAVRMRSIRGVGTVAVSIVAGNSEAKRLVRQDRASAGQVG
jgi:glycosyltransferase involved in cell wall biosynthesis